MTPDQLERLKDGATHGMWSSVHNEDLQALITAYEEQWRALESIAHPPYGLGFNKLRGIARRVMEKAR